MITQYRFSVSEDLNQGKTIIPIDEISLPRQAFFFLLAKAYPCTCDLKKEETGELVKIEVTGYNLSNYKNNTPLQIIVNPLPLDVKKGDSITVKNDDPNNDVPTIAKEKTPHQSKLIDVDIPALYKKTNGFNLTQEELDQVFSVVKSKVKKEEDTVMSSTEKKLDSLVFRVLARADIDQEAPMLNANGGPPLYKKRHIQKSKNEMIITDENGMTGFAPLP